jgi:hypothetical protein
MTDSQIAAAKQLLESLAFGYEVYSRAELRAICANILNDQKTCQHSENVKKSD